MQVHFVSLGSHEPEFPLDLLRNQDPLTLTSADGEFVEAEKKDEFGGVAICNLFEADKDTQAILIGKCILIFATESLGLKADNVVVCYKDDKFGMLFY